MHKHLFSGLVKSGKMGPTKLLVIPLVVSMCPSVNSSRAPANSREIHVDVSASILHFSVILVSIGMLHNLTGLLGTDYNCCCKWQHLMIPWHILQHSGIGMRVMLCQLRWVGTESDECVLIAIGLAFWLLL